MLRRVADIDADITLANGDRLTSKRRASWSRSYERNADGGGASDRRSRLRRGHRTGNRFFNQWSPACRQRSLISCRHRVMSRRCQVLPRRVSGFEIETELLHALDLNLPSSARLSMASGPRTPEQAAFTHGLRIPPDLAAR
jgi:hypothetical protein